MRVLHPDGNMYVFMQNGTPFMASLETNNPGWVSIGYIGGSGGMVIDHLEWSSFVAMIGEIDAAVKEMAK